MKHDLDAKTPSKVVCAFVATLAGGVKFHYLREWLEAVELVSVPVSVWAATLALAIAVDIVFLYALRNANPYKVLSGFMIRFVAVPTAIFYSVVAFPDTLFAEVVLAFFTWFVSITIIIAVFTILFSLRKEKFRNG